MQLRIPQLQESLTAIIPVTRYKDILSRLCEMTYNCKWSPARDTGASHIYILKRTLL
jgi:hypothetical protein